MLEAIVGVLLFVWNVSITILNARAGDTEHIDGRGLVWPAVAAVIFFQHYWRLLTLKEAIRTLSAESVKGMAKLGDQLLKRKIKDVPEVVEAAGRACRVLFMGDSVFYVHKGLQQAFEMPAVDFRACIADLNAKKLKFAIDACSRQGQLSQDPWVVRTGCATCDGLSRC